jgi:hypothetical protein
MSPSRHNDRYGYAHKQIRRRWGPKVRAGGVVCWRCGRPIGATERWDLGHVDEDGRACGFPPRHPECLRCNRGTLPRMLAKARSEAEPMRHSRDW